MADVREATAALLAEKPDLEDDLYELLAVDAEDQPWEFQDVPLDSGAFGEVVSRGIVEKQSTGYRIADPDALRAALEADAVTNQESTSDLIPAVPSYEGKRDIDAFLPAIGVDGRLVGMVGGVLLLVAGFRLLSVPAVFRGSDVVLSGNDPYYYRYLVEQLASQTHGPLDFGGLTEIPNAKGEPLLVATLWWLTELLGGSAHTAGVVLAFYPILGAVLTGGLVYAIAARAFGDRRIGLAAVGMLAVVPVHAFRTSLGFADHHAFDYPWIALTLLALVMISERPVRQRLTSLGFWAGVAGVAIAIAGQILAWEAGPLLIGALGGFVILRVLADIRAAQSPFVENTPVVVGLVGAVAITHFAHTVLGWHTDQVTYAPGLLLVGVIGVLAVAELAYRLDLPPIVPLLGETALVVLGWVLLPRFLPSYAARLNSRLAFLFSNRGVVEMTGLVSQSLFVRPILFFGFLLFLTLPVLVWLSWRGYRDYRPAWLAIAVYTWYFFGLSLIQIRFGGELGVPLAVSSGLGFAFLAVRIEVIRPLTVFDGDRTSRTADGGATHAEGALGLPGRRNAVYLVLLFLLVSSLSLAQIPIKTNQLTIPEDTYQAAVWIEGDAADRGLAYPRNYVLSRWDRNRVYNYFVNGHSRSYGYARSTYGEFLVGRSGEDWYERLKGRVGYIVISDDLEGRVAADSLYVRLYQQFGSRTAETAGLAHYRAVWTTSDGSHKVFLLVPGATITGTAAPNTTIPLSTSVSIPGSNFTYSRTAHTGPTGNFTVTVAYPGRYTIANETVRINETAVMNGTTIDTR